MLFYEDRFCMVCTRTYDCLLIKLIICRWFRLPFHLLLLSFTSVFLKINESRLWSFNSSPLRLRKPSPKSSQVLQQSLVRQTFCQQQQQQQSSSSSPSPPISVSPSPSVSLPLVPPTPPPLPPSHQEQIQVQHSVLMNKGEGPVTPNLPLNKYPSANVFRFPPWSGPSSRTVSSPGLSPVTPDSPVSR